MYLRYAGRLATTLVVIALMSGCGLTDNEKTDGAKPADASFVGSAR